MGTYSSLQWGYVLETTRGVSCSTLFVGMNAESAGEKEENDCRLPARENTGAARDFNVIGLCDWWNDSSDVDRA